MSEDRPKTGSEFPAELHLGLDDGPAGAPGGAFDDAILEPWEDVGPEVEFERARVRMQFRGLVFFAVTLVAVWSIFGWPIGASTLADFRYFLSGGDDPVDLGDVRALRSSGRSSLDVASNSYVRLENLVMTYEAESDTYQYFFCPLFNVVVRTPRTLPEKEIYRSVEIPSDLLYLVENRLAFAEDLTTGFSGEGRLLRADDAPRLRFLYEAYARTVTNPIPPEETWIFLDGDTPSTYWPYAAGYALAIVLVVMTGFFFWRAVRVYARLRAEL